MRESYFFLILLPLCLLPVAFLIRNLKETYLPYTKKTSVMTQAEKQYFLRLQQTYGNQYYIFPQINLDKLIKVTDKRNFYSYFNKINRKSVDFVIVNKNTLETIKVIELDDYTHKWSTRIKRDYQVNKIFEKVGIPIEHIT